MPPSSPSSSTRTPGPRDRPTGARARAVLRRLVRLRGSGVPIVSVGRAEGAPGSPPTPFEVRELRSVAEARALGDLTVEVYTGLAGLAPGSPYLDELGAVERRAAAAVVLVAVDAGGGLTGGVTYVPGLGPYAEFDDPDGAGLRMLAVASAHRGRGVGTALVQACIERARAEGRRRLWLHTTADMPVAQRIYARLGFRRVPEADRHLPEIDLLGYVLDLDAPLSPSADAPG